MLAALDAAKDPREIFEDVVWRHRGKKITPKTVNQKRYVDAIRSGRSRSGSGRREPERPTWPWPSPSRRSPTGTSTASSSRPAVEAGERLGFLPGDMLAKVDPYLRPLFDALYDMLDADRLNAFMERGTIEWRPLAFMRGRTLNDSFIILDEAQNTTPEQMQMFLTRLGFGSKVVVTGDVTQIDLPQDQASGLIHVRRILGDIDDIGFVEFGNQDVVRHVLVQRSSRRTSATPRDGHPAAPVIRIEIANRSGAEVDEAAVADLCRRVLAREGVDEGDLGVSFEPPGGCRS